MTNLVKACLSFSVVIDHLISENAKSLGGSLPEANEVSETDKAFEPTTLTFTHEQSTDHLGYYFNETLQMAIGE